MLKNSNILLSMYDFFTPKRLFTMPYLYVYLIFENTKNVNIEIESIIKSCMLNSEETSNLYNSPYM